MKEPKRIYRYYVESTGNCWESHVQDVWDKRNKHRGRYLFVVPTSTINTLLVSTIRYSHKLVVGLHYLFLVRGIIVLISLLHRNSILYTTVVITTARKCRWISHIIILLEYNCDTFAISTTSKTYVCTFINWGEMKILKP